MDSLTIKYCWTVFELVSSTLAHNPLEHLVAPNRVLLVEDERLSLDDYSASITVLRSVLSSLIEREKLD